MSNNASSLTNQYSYNLSSPIVWVLSHIARYKSYFTFYILGSVGWHILGSAILPITGMAFDEVLQTTTGQNRLLTISLAILGIVLLRGLFGLAASSSIEIVATNLEADARKELYANLLNKSQTFHNRQRVGDVTARATDDMTQLKLMIAPGIDLVLDSIFSLILPLVFIGFLNVELLLSPLIFTIAFVIAIVHFGNGLGPVSGQLQEQFGHLQADLTEIISGIEIVKSTAQERQETRKFEKNARRYRDFYVQLGLIQARYLPSLLLVLALVGAFLHGLYLFSQGDLSVGSFIAYLGLVGLLRIPTSISNFSPVFIHLGLAAADRIVALIKAEAKPDADQFSHAGNIKGEIVFENVTFSYGSSPVLKDISFRVQPGETVAIVGQTGSGKSTLTKLLNRTYDPNEGRILIDGVDVRDWSLGSLRTQISSIEQNVTLFSKSIAKNIAFGLGEHVDQHLIRLVAQEAQAHKFITGFKDGYDTIVGEQGQTLSGGQRQRLAIARALLTDPRVLILDDATSAVDSATENEIQKAIFRVLKERTTFLITNRLSLVRQADKILVLRKGELIDQGTHHDLLKRCGLYQRIFAAYDDYTFSIPVRVLPNLAR